MTSAYRSDGKRASIQSAVLTGIGADAGPPQAPQEQRKRQDAAAANGTTRRAPGGQRDERVRRGREQQQRECGRGAAQHGRGDGGRSQRAPRALDAT